MASNTYQGLIVNHDADLFSGQIDIDTESGLITKVTKNNNSPISKNPKTIIFPGMGDVHIHAREDQTGEQLYKESYTTSANAALNGGLVHVAAMPNTPKPVTTAQDLEWHRNRIEEINHPVSILNYIGIANGTRPIDEPGKHPYKAFFGKSVGDLTFHDEHELEDTLQHYRGHHVSFHVEYEPFIQASADGKTHSERRPIGAVNYGLKLLLPLIEKYEINAKLCHWSTGGDSFDMIQDHRQRSQENGLPYTTVEVSPLHLLFDTKMASEDPSLWLKIQMNPAIQGPMHRKALLKGLKDGFIDYIATDHAPHTVEEKHSAFSQYKDQYKGLNNEEIAQKMQKQNIKKFKETCCQNGMSGAPWLDNYASIVTNLMATEAFTPQDIARVTAYNPGNFSNQFLPTQNNYENYGKGFGKIEEGYIGSLTILETQGENYISNDNGQTKVGWSPLENRSLIGSLHRVIVRGKEQTGNFTTE
ncbi:MAG: dihydroorotase [Patescibacteria group bacterium]